MSTYEHIFVKTEASPEAAGGVGTADAAPWGEDERVAPQPG